MNETVQRGEYSRAMMVEKTCNRILKRDFEGLKKYFKNIVDNKYDCIIFISRRCYILYQMIAIIERWNCNEIYTDLGIYAMRKKIAKCKRVIVVDDIGFTGMSLTRVLKRIRKYTRFGCQISVSLYAKNKENIEALSKVKISKYKSIKVKDYCQLTNGQCQTLSFRLVSALLASGMPYTTFVYPIWGKIEKRIEKDYYKSYHVDTKRAILNEFKWDTSYIYQDNILWADKLSKFYCVRMYQNKGGEFVSFLPFMFMKDMETENVEKLYGNIADTFKELGKVKFADEMMEAMHEKQAWKKDAVEYMACVLSCFCSKALAETMKLEKNFKIRLEDSYVSLKGSFSEEFINVLKDCDEEFATAFFEKIIDKIDSIDIAKSYRKQKKYIYYEELKRYIETEALNKSAYDITSTIFEWMRKKSSENVLRSDEIRTINFDDLLILLRETKKYKEDEIYLAQIECWDRGIATYRFSYDEKNGIVSTCTVGEMSSLITSLKYQKIIREYYKAKLLFDDEMDELTQKNILKQVLEKIVDTDEYTTSDIKKFWEILDERQESLYGMLI